MNTVQEALFKAMLQESWFTASDGDVDYALGYFGWMHNHNSEWFEVSQAFCDVLTAYAPDLELGANPPEWFAGVFFAQLDSNGILWISKLGDVDNEITSLRDMAINPAVAKAKAKFDSHSESYQKWSNA